MRPECWSSKKKSDLVRWMFVLSAVTIASVSAGLAKGGGSHGGGHSGGHNGGHSGSHGTGHAGGYSGGHAGGYSGGHAGGYGGGHAGGYGGGHAGGYGGGHAGGYSGGHDGGYRGSHASSGYGYHSYGHHPSGHHHVFHDTFFHPHLGFGAYYGAPRTYYPSSYAYASDLGYVDLDVYPVEAEVYLDGEYIGTADEFDSSRSSLQVSPGRHTIEFELQGFLSYRLDLSVRPGATLRIPRNLRPSGRSGRGY